MRSRNVPLLVPQKVRRRLASGALASTMLLAACGGADEPASSADSIVASPQEEAPDSETGDAATSVDAAEGGEASNADAGDEGADAGEAADSEASAGESASPEPETDAPADNVAARVNDGKVDLVGPDVIDAANIDTNLLPDVVLDDLTNDRKVNFRNLVPQNKPILLWMYAPH